MLQGKLKFCLNKYYFWNVIIYSTVICNGIMYMYIENNYKYFFLLCATAVETD